MTSKNDGGPAFPKPLDPWSNVQERSSSGGECGMSLRDWFAGHVIAGLHLGTEDTAQIHYERRATEAYRIADAMLAERTK